jgi:DNA (cytosine-5)-methyltransferase 1
MRFIDVFAGCGGLSLGLLKAGCQGVAAIEKNSMAFETLRHNLIEGRRYSFDWPDWLPKQAMSCEQLLNDHRHHLSSLTGTIDLMVGGPPCQGFSLAGRRNPADPRNKMAEQYLELVKIIKPKFILIENVSGFNSKFDESKRKNTDDDMYFKKSYAEYISEELSSVGYFVYRGKINCADFGVPQNRHRYFIICTKEEGGNLFEKLSKYGESFRVLKGLNPKRYVSVHDAISDLEVSDKKLVESTDSPVRGFSEISYQQPDILPPYLRLMRDGHEGAPNSLRLPKHKVDTVLQFIKIRQASEPGRCLSKESRDRLGLKKHAITVLAKNFPSPTITTLPDDIIHYSEPRILTARETARIQSFPDWFEFTGKYTTGGLSRKLDCPRYTQIGNAVPPLLSEAIGMMLYEEMLAEDVCGEASKL